MSEQANYNQEPDTHFLIANLDPEELKALNSNLIKKAGKRDVDIDIDEIFTDLTFSGRHSANLMNQIHIFQRKSKLTYGFKITSHRKVMGPFLVFGKKAVRRLLKWLFEPFLAQQTEVNQASFIMHQYQLKVLQDLEERIQEIELLSESEREK